MSLLICVLRRLAGCLAILLVSLGAGGFARADCQAGSGITLQAIKGVGMAPLASGRQVTVVGTVTAVFMAPRALGGFFLQQGGMGGRPPEGIFVYQPQRGGSANPAVGERVVLSARTGRYRGRIQLERVTRTLVCGPDRALRAWPLSLPAKSVQLQRLEDVLVRVPARLTVTSNYQLAHYGTLGLSVDGRLFQPENGTGAVAGRSAGILLDDGSYHAVPRPIPYLNGTGTRRLGSALINLTGVLTKAFGRWRIQPSIEPRFRDTNPRPARPARRAGALRLASFNMENYFINRGGRGAESAAAFRRQQRKLVEAIVALDADVLALHEVENRHRAVAALVRAINTASPSEARYLAAAAGADYGSGAIRTVLLYREQRLVPRSVWINEDSVFTRPPIAADFRRLDGEPATVGVVAAHLKSKGGCRARGDSDQGRGCWGRLRRRQAAALSQWLKRLQAAVDQPRFLLMGDLNSYPGEAAVQTLLSAGLRDLIAERVAPADRYTYVYHGYAGYLDHALATVALADAVGQVAIWHINADEPRYLGYTNPRAKPTFYRSSDHDPVVVDLR
ncbi:ExeM/NucH family extracellular endonuclease [Nitrococcus mobilis]|uniref:ExeM/NucH family extracellular endonuclease n=1 Tax=Nitrococcus mobilis TaxID=35797 RepID=UPI00058EF5C4|nr:ExeM/NucH family extracellular endonuclease [Nitrococcus mobilis]